MQPGYAKLKPWLSSMKIVTKDAKQLTERQFVCSNIKGYFLSNALILTGVLLGIAGHQFTILVDFVIFLWSDQLKTIITFFMGQSKISKFSEIRICNFIHNYDSHCTLRGLWNHDGAYIAWFTPIRKENCLKLVSITTIYLEM